MLKLVRRIRRQSVAPTAVRSSDSREVWQQWDTLYIGSIMSALAIRMLRDFKLNSAFKVPLQSNVLTQSVTKFSSAPLSVHWRVSGESRFNPCSDEIKSRHQILYQRANRTRFSIILKHLDYRWLRNAESRSSATNKIIISEP